MRTKKLIAAVYFIIVSINIVIAILLFKSRFFSHLAIWNIVESDKQNDFYWRPEDAPDYFLFGANTDKLAIFRKDIVRLIKKRDNDLEIALGIARHLLNITSSNNIHSSTLPVRWGSPEEMLRQARDGGNANCFHMAVLYSTYLASLDIKSRLWALENEKFDSVSHTIIEIYINGLKKWIFMDMMFGFYAVDNSGTPLSFLELRRWLLYDSPKIIYIYNIYDEKGGQIEMPVFYSRLVKCSFLRADNDFVNKHNVRTRYGILYPFHRYIDTFPDNIRRGLNYLFGGRYTFVHYVDSFSGRLKSEIILSKSLFYFFIFSILFIICQAVFLIMRRGIDKRRNP